MLSTFKNGKEYQVKMLKGKTKKVKCIKEYQIKIERMKKWRYMKTINIISKPLYSKAFRRKFWLKNKIKETTETR